MKTAFFTAASLMIVAMSTLPVAPAAAQYRERVQIIYGNDACPTSNGQEIVICARLSENERYRIPKELRDGVNITGAGTWAQKAESLEYVGASGTNSCSPVGAGGATGCVKQMLTQAREERGQEPLVKF